MPASMQRTPPKSKALVTTSGFTQQAKRKLQDTSPEDTMKTGDNLVGNVALKDLMQLMKSSIEEIMGEKLKNVEEKLETVSTKTDIEEIKNQIEDVNVKYDNILKENSALREEIEQLKKDRQMDHQQIQRISDQARRKNVIFRGIVKDGSPKTSVEKVCTNILKLPEVQVNTVRVLFTGGNKINVVAEMKEEDMANKIFKNLRNLAGSKIKIEKDLNESRQQDRKVMMQLKAEILDVNRTHKVFVKNDCIKVGVNWMMWNNNRELVCGKKGGKEVLFELYGEKINSINVNYNVLLEKINQKN